jgi:hypothetical protein
MAPLLKSLKIYPYRALGCKEAKNSLDFTTSYMRKHILRKELFYQIIYHDSSNFTDRAVHGANPPHP